MRSLPQLIMKDMGTIERLSEQEVKELENKVHYFNKLNFTMSSTSSSTSTPLIFLRDSTSKILNTGGIFSVISQVASDISDGLTSIVNHRIGQYAASLDIRKAYRQIRVSERDAMLRLSVSDMAIRIFEIRCYLEIRPYSRPPPLTVLFSIGTPGILNSTSK